jgi:hypothetical protein
MIPEPPLPHLIVRENYPHRLPKRLAMVGIAAMSEFMDNDIINDGQWGLNETPVQGNQSILSAEAPTGFVLRDLEPCRTSSQHRGIVVNALGEQF